MTRIFGTYGLVTKSERSIGNKLLMNGKRMLIVMITIYKNHRDKVLFLTKIFAYSAKIVCRYPSEGSERSNFPRHP